MVNVATLAVLGAGGYFYMQQQKKKKEEEAASGESNTQESEPVMDPETGEMVYPEDDYDEYDDYDDYDSGGSDKWCTACDCPHDSNYDNGTEACDCKGNQVYGLEKNSPTCKCIYGFYNPDDPAALPEDDIECVCMMNPTKKKCLDRQQIGDEAAAGLKFTADNAACLVGAKKEQFSAFIMKSLSVATKVVSSFST